MALHKAELMKVEARDYFEQRIAKKAAAVAQAEEEAAERAAKRLARGPTPPPTPPTKPSTPEPDQQEEEEDDSPIRDAYVQCTAPWCWHGLDGALYVSSPSKSKPGASASPPPPPPPPASVDDEGSKGVQVDLPWVAHEVRRPPVSRPVAISAAWSAVHDYSREVHLDSLLHHVEWRRQLPTSPRAAAEAAAAPSPRARRAIW